ncbi:Sorbitol dehydrogenase [bacterium HR15]|nr:Sorbitol dehydrogenase [bacterium HR15]
MNGKEGLSRPSDLPDLVELQVPTHTLRWNLYGAGLENLGRAGKPELVPTPHPAPTQLLVRMDAVGICYSDVKIVRLGNQHPKLFGRDLRQHPVVMGHEIACTVVAVGDALTDRFRVGERYVVQADVYLGGKNMAIGYALDGGFTQYGLITEPALFGDEGCYLLPCPEHLSYAEAALVEPWACVVASYRLAPRPTPRPNARWLVILPHAPEVHYRCRALETLQPEGAGGIAVIAHDARGNPLAEAFLRTAQRLGMSVHTLACSPDQLASPTMVHTLKAQHTHDEGFDDILLFGDPTPALLEACIDALAYGGHLSFTCHRPVPPVAVDVGRLHYDRLMVMGTTSWDITDAQAHTRSTALSPTEQLLLLGAGGPMGQMHLHYALSQPECPEQIVVVDRHEDRLDVLRSMLEASADGSRAEVHFYNAAGVPLDHQQEALRALSPYGYSQIMCLSSAPEAVSMAYPLLSDGGVLNLFAGIPRGVKVPLDLTLLATRHLRLMGSSGSSMADMAHCLRLAAEGVLPVGRVLSAIGGLNALPEAIQAVQQHRYSGKIVLFPHLPTLPLIGLHELHTLLPEVASYLKQGRFWTKAAETALFARGKPRYS